MKNVVTSVMPDSIAEEVGIEVNDILLSINGEKIVDIIDYRFLTADEEIVLEIQKPDGEIWEYEIEKDYGEEIGLEFGGGIMDKAKRCSNKCMFCFMFANGNSAVFDLICRFLALQKFPFSVAFLFWRDFHNR